MHTKDEFITAIHVAIGDHPPEYEFTFNQAELVGFLSDAWTLGYKDGVEDQPIKEK